MFLFRAFTIVPYLAALAASAPAAAQAVDAARGKAIFIRCSVCHSTTPGVNKLGPSLAGIVGRKAGSTPGFAFSQGMRTSNVVWTAKTLDAFLLRPQAVVKGNKMAFAGISNPADRAAVIAYLASPK